MNLLQDNSTTRAPLNFQKTEEQQGNNFENNVILHVLFYWSRNRLWPEHSNLRVSKSKCLFSI